MTKFLFVRLAGALATAALALFIVGLVPFLDAVSTAGAGLATRTLPVTVDRSYKGDRLPLFAEAKSAVSHSETKSSQSPHEVPFACEPAFSPVSSPRLALIYGRCLS
jgi:hypothetical protein